MRWCRAVLALAAAIVAFGGAKPHQDGPAAAELVAVWGFGDPAALAVSPDETTLYSAEGQGVRVYSLDRLPLGPERELGWISVDGAIVHMFATDRRLYIAGGSQGVFAVDLSQDGWPVRSVAQRGAKVATAVAEAEGRLWCLFAARDSSVLSVFDGHTFELVAERELGPGTAWALAVDQRAAYVAMGHGGLLRVRLEAEELHVDPGPRGPGPFPAQRGFALRPGNVRDVALDVTLENGRLWAAADAGLVEIDLAHTFAPDMPLRVHSFEPGGLPTYGRRVAARDGRVAFGSNAGPNELLDGAPYNAFGAMGRAVRLADLDPKSFVRGDVQHLYVGSYRDGELVLDAPIQPGGDWRGLALGETRIYEQHLRAGLAIRERRGDQYERVHQSQPLGYPSAHGTFSVSRPERLLFGVDSAGAEFEGYLEFDGDGLTLLEFEGAPEFTPGLMPGTPWRGEEPHTEWLVDGLGFDLRLVRLSHGAGVRVEHWIVPQPGATEGRAGHTYFHSLMHGGVLLVARTGSSHGLIGYSRSDLVAAAERTKTGEALDVAALWELETRADLGEEGTVHSKRAMKLAVGQLPDGPTLLSLAAGFDAESDRSLVLLFELGEKPSALPRPVGALRGDEGPKQDGNPSGGNAITTAFLPRGERLFLAVADIGNGVQCYDVTRPEAPIRGAHWSPAPNVFDGRTESLVDMVADGERLYLAYGRLGLVVLDARRPGTHRLAPLSVLDTPGLAYGVALGEIDGRKYVALGDHQAGVRLYRLALR